jgi:hypothetical protein
MACRCFRSTWRRPSSPGARCVLVPLRDRARRGVLEGVFSHNDFIRQAHPNGTDWADSAHASTRAPAHYLPPIWEGGGGGGSEPYRLSCRLPHADFRCCVLVRHREIEAFR